jgi:hypothetical protein
MAMNEFLHNVQTARNVALFNQAVERGRNPLAPVPSYTGLRRAAQVWLSPRIVAGYDAEDFRSLSQANQDALATGVSGYRTVAEAVAGREPTDDELLRAADALFVIVGALDSDLLDTEGKVLLDAVCEAGGKEPFPDFVLGLDYTLDTDWSGDPGIWIWVIIPDELDPDSAEFLRFVTRFPKVVSPALIRAKSDRFPYIHYRLLSEATGEANAEVA